MSGYWDQQIGQYSDIVRKTVSTVATMDKPITVGPGKPGESAVGGTMLPQSSTIENKTKKSYAVKQSGEMNVLNGYRSYTYNFTMAALSLDEVNNPDSYRTKPLTRVILKSGGKGPNAISDNSALTKGFNNNKNSAGRFDMFIENLEIDSVMGFTKNSSVSLSTNLAFEVIEPYSINGFIEALQVAAVSAGYLSYTTASFVLHMEFMGYPDNVPVEDSKPEYIPNSSRYFMFRFAGVSVDVNEQGTRYKCVAHPWNQAGFGQPNKLKKPIQIKGNTVGEILDNFMVELNEQIADADKLSKEGDSSLHDKYAVKYPSVTLSGFDDKNPNSISTKKIVEFHKSASIEFVDPSDSTSNDAYNGHASAARDFVPPEQNKLNTAGKATIQFAAGAAIHECIASVIRDSEFGSNIIKKIGVDGTEGAIDEYGFINYFSINIEVENLGIDTVKRKPRQQFTYVIAPYRVHYTAVTNYAGQHVDVTKIKKYVSLRNYNYIYTGQNVDVLSFKINFNNLYFEAAPYAMGNNDKNRSINSAGPDNGINPKETASDVGANYGSGSVGPPKLVDEKLSKINPSGGMGNQLDADPYNVLARSMHEAIINSNIGMITGDIDIIGDPFFVVTGGMGKFNPPLENIGKTINGESAYNYGEVYITINFKNPIDISTFENGGQLYFDPATAQFSGVYKVTKVRSSFKSGLFTQRLDLIRLTGQITDNTRASDAKSVVKQVTDENNATSEDTSEAIMPGLRATISSPGLLASAGAAGLKVPAGFNLASTLDRALPGTGNFTAAAGGLGGNLLNSVSGAVTSAIGAVTAGASVFGGSIPGGVDQLASGIRFNAAGLASTGGIQDKINALTAGTPLDPTGMASKLGIDTSQISGLGSSLKSKLLGQLGSFAKDVPANVDLGAAAAQGMALDLIPKDKLANIPAIAQYAVPPLPELPKFGSTNITSDVAASFAKINPLSGIPAPSVTSPLSNLYSLTSGKK